MDGYYCKMDTTNSLRYGPSCGLCGNSCPGYTQGIGHNGMLESDYDDSDLAAPL